MESLSSCMHPRNIYQNPLDFVELCNQYPELLKYTNKKPSGKIIFNFKDRHGLRCLCQVLLKKDFNLDVIIPENTLIPTLPLRLNYILWIEDLLQNVSKNGDFDHKISGIDIGTGSTCIYPLLIAKKNGWKMTGTDITDDISKVARDNVKRNNLDHLISIIKTSSPLSEVLPADEVFDFCMCNPPFFDSLDQETPLPKKRNRAARQQEAKLKASGTSNEIASPGGEVAFIKNIIEDSSILRDRIRIYTTMLGCKSSVQPVVEALKEKEIHSFCETQFCQGRTMRWGIAWTLTDISLESSVPALPPKRNLPKPLIWILQSPTHFKECVGKMNEMLEKLQMHFTLTKESKRAAVWKIEALRNTWTGLRRRRREQQRKEEIDSFLDIEKSSVSEGKSDEIPIVADVTDCVSAKRRADFGSGDDEDREKCKKARIDDMSDDPVLEAEIELGKVRHNKDGNISIRIVFMKGQKEAPHQLLQYFKNNLV